MGTPEEWVDTAYAERTLGVKQRELQRKVTAYPLQLGKRSERRGRSTVTLYRLSDLIAFRDRTKQGIDPAVTERALRDDSAPEEPVEDTDVVLARSFATRAGSPALAAILARLHETLERRPEQGWSWNPPPAPEPKRWMSIAEAAAYLGLPESEIKLAIAAKELGYRDVGRGTQQRIRIRRRDLDAL